MSIRPRDNEYAELKRIVKSHGLLEKQPLYYFFKISLVLGLLVASLIILAGLDSIWLILTVSVFMAYLFTELSAISHEAGHRQIFRDSTKDDILFLILGNLLLGVSMSWWLDKHNRHHSNPNQLGVDPDIDFAVFAFSDDQALAKKGLLRFIVKHQAYIFFPIQLMVAVYNRVVGFKFLLTNKSRYRILEGLLAIASVVLYVGGFFYLIGGWQAVIFMLVHHALWGFHLGMIFAPNHKGMPLFTEDSQLDFLRQQVLTARNVKPYQLASLFYGGLNYQIEHHLFPGIARNKLRETQRIVKAFCSEKRISYHEATIFGSYQEMFQFFRQASSLLRRPAQ